MLVSTLLDFYCGGQISKGHEALDAGVQGTVADRVLRRQKRFLWISLVANLGLLAYFKYFNFGLDSFNVLLGLAGAEPVQWPKIVLPVGISFYTFQSMSYSIDVYRRDAPAVRSFTDFACYIALFPQLVAGPIVRYQTLAQQLVQRNHTVEKLARGAFLFQLGFAKKILLADPMGRIADAAYGLANPTLVESWLGTIAYAFQIYFDFSGYSDMAIGLGALFGFVFPINFDSPYKSASITEFWRRWHISLSTWLRDYLYIPLGGNRKGSGRTYVNLMLTMLLGGLWHGAAWTFLLWGAWQGTWLALERRSGKSSAFRHLPHFIQVLCTFVIVLGGWVLFRATSIAQVGDFYGGMIGLAGWNGLRFPMDQMSWVQLGLAAIVVWGLPNSQKLSTSPSGWPRLVIPALFVVAIARMFQSEYSPFLYFQF